MLAATATLKRHEIRKILRSKRGELARLAKDLGVARNLVSQVLKGFATSARVYSACERRAQELLEESK